MSVGGCEDVSSIMLLEYDFMSHTVGHKCTHLKGN